MKTPNYWWNDNICKVDGTGEASFNENVRSAVAATVDLRGITGGYYHIKSQTKLATATGCSESAPLEVTSGGAVRLKSTLTTGLSAETCTGYDIVVAYRFQGVDIECEIEVEVNDINEGPSFGATSYVRDVEEDKPEDTAVGQALEASDPDRGESTSVIDWLGNISRY